MSIIKNYIKKKFSFAEFKELMKLDVELSEWDESIKYNKKTKILSIHCYNNGHWQEHLYNVGEFKELINMQDKNINRVYVDINIDSEQQETIVVVEYIENGK